MRSKKRADLSEPESLMDEVETNVWMLIDVFVGRMCDRGNLI